MESKLKIINDTLIKELEENRKALVAHLYLVRGQIESFDTRDTQEQKLKETEGILLERIKVSDLMIKNTKDLGERISQIEI